MRERRVIAGRELFDEMKATHGDVIDGFNAVTEGQRELHHQNDDGFSATLAGQREIHRTVTDGFNAVTEGQRQTSEKIDRGFVATRAAIYDAANSGRKKPIWWLVLCLILGAAIAIAFYYSVINHTHLPAIGMYDYVRDAAGNVTPEAIQKGTKLWYFHDGAKTVMAILSALLGATIGALAYFAAPIYRKEA